MLLLGLASCAIHMHIREALTAWSLIELKDISNMRDGTELRREQRANESGNNRNTGALVVIDTNLLIFHLNPPASLTVRRFQWQTKERVKTVDDHVMTSSSVSSSSNIEVRAMGLINRRRYWYVVDDSSPYLYWYKDPDSLKSGNDVYLVECSSNRLRDEWMQVLQAARLRSVRAVKDDEIAHDIISMSSETPPIPNVPSPTQSAQNLIDDLLGPVSDTASTSTDDGQHLDTLLNGLDIEGHESDEDGAYITPSSTFYLTTNGELNEHSMAMPKVFTSLQAIVSPESVVERILEKTNEHLEAPKRAFQMARRSLRLKKECEETEAMIARCVELEDMNAALREAVDKLQRGLLVARNQNDILERMQTLVCDDDTRALLLAKETEITDLQLSNNQRYRQIRELQAEIRLFSHIQSNLQGLVQVVKRHDVSTIR
ncbi:hypothetical protein ANCCEY_05429 [Ancylostoma ceylanicum]|uniref:PH domain-containing protein n=1 Tax=Ancylostoma ceylanicum TaxID=53326 RepID=A0A0D6LUE0_9BILA|nr:hypothetical protein ANCCEY_05429 [Ancylostoma ceylanicum]